MNTVNTPGPGQNPPIGNFDQPVLAIGDPQNFNSMKSAISNCFSASKLESFLRSLDRQNLRIRSFEAVLGKGLLGESTSTAYAALGNGDQGQIREFYLASLERVSPELRTKFFKLYAYY